MVPKVKGYLSTLNRSIYDGILLAKMKVQISESYLQKSEKGLKYDDISQKLKIPIYTCWRLFSGNMNMWRPFTPFLGYE